MEEMQKALGTKVAEAASAGPRRIFVRVEPGDLFATVKYLRDRFNFTHLSTITGVDRTDAFELLYHLANENCILTVRTRISRTEPVIPSLTPVIPGAVLYEREIQDMFGIKVEGIPDSRPLLWSDDWPEGNYPLRKDWTFERRPENIPGEGQ